MVNYQNQCIYVIKDDLSFLPWVFVFGAVLWTGGGGAGRWASGLDGNDWAGLSNGFSRWLRRGGGCGANSVEEFVESINRPSSISCEMRTKAFKNNLLTNTVHWIFN